MNSDRYNDGGPSWAADMDTDTEESVIKKEPEILDGAQELLAQEHHDSSTDKGLKRKREQDGMDQTQPDNDAQYLDFPGKSEGVDQAHVKGEATVAVNRPEVMMQDTPTTQEAEETVAKGEYYYCCGCNENIPTYTQFVKHILSDHSEQRSIKHFQMKPNISDPNNNCNACERPFNTRTGYCRHLREVHNFDTRELVNANQSRLESLVKTDYYCSGCNQYMKDEASFQKHINMTHYRSKIKHLHLMPDINHPNWYCQACERAFESKVQFAAHLRLIHNIRKRRTLEDVDQPQDEDQPQDGDQPQEANSSHFCCGCNKYMPDQISLMRHIATVHSATRIKHFNVKPDVDDPNYYCKACERSYLVRGLYRQHLRTAHKMVLPRPNKIDRPNQVIDGTQPESYLCNSCNVTIQEHSNYLTHIASCHSKLVLRPPTNVKPDYYDPNHYCKACDKTHPSQKKYRQHLQRIHKVIVQGVTVRVPALSTTESEYFCCACNATVADYETYMAHITTQHPRSRIKHLHIKPDIYNPDYYCSACEKAYSSRNPFMSHLKVLHNITVKYSQRKQLYPKSRRSREYSSELSQSSDSRETTASLDTLEAAFDTSTTPEASQAELDISTTPEVSQADIDINTIAEEPQTDLDISTIGEEPQTALDRTKPAASLNTLQTANDVSTTAPVEQELGDTKTIDLHKAKNYCHYCQLQYKSQAEFRSHLGELHSLITTRSRGNVFSTSSPTPEPAVPSRKTWNLVSPLEHLEPLDATNENIKSQGKSKLPHPNNAGYKCEVCESHFKYKSVMREHCKDVHQMQLAPIRYKRNPKVIIRVSRKRS